MDNGIHSRILRIMKRLYALRSVQANLHKSYKTQRNKFVYGRLSVGFKETEKDRHETRDWTQLNLTEMKKKRSRLHAHTGYTLHVGDCEVYLSKGIRWTLWSRWMVTRGPGLALGQHSTVMVGLYLG